MRRGDHKVRRNEEASTELSIEDICFKCGSVDQGDQIGDVGSDEIAFEPRRARIPAW